MNDLPAGYKRYQPTGCQSLPKPGALKILDWGQDLLIRMEWGDCDLTKKTMPRPAEASQKTASPWGAHTARVSPPFCPVLLSTLYERRPQWDWLSPGPGPAFIHASRLFFQAGFSVKDGGACYMCSYTCFIAQGQTNKRLLSTSWRIQLKSIWGWE